MTNCIFYGYCKRTKLWRAEVVDRKTLDCLEFRNAGNLHDIEMEVSDLQEEYSVKQEYVIKIAYR